MRETVGGIPGDWTAFNNGNAAFTVNAAPVASASPNPATTGEDTPVEITLKGTDADGNALLFQITDGPDNGAFARPAPTPFAGTCSNGTCTATVTYVPNANFNGQDSFSFIVSDGIVESAPTTVNITVSAVNDPVGTVAPGAVSLAEDSVDFAVTGMSITDADAALAPAGVYEVSLSATHGTLTLTTATGLTFTAGDGTSDATMTFHGTLADINTALATVTFQGDPNYSNSASVTLNVTDTFGGTVATGTGAATSDTDTVNITVSPVADLSISDSAKAEGNAGTTTFTFTVTLDSPAPAGGVSFNYSTSDGTATVAGDDYEPASASGSVAAGETSTTITVTVNGDTEEEPNETFSVTVSNVTNAQVADGTCTGTILNDDGAPEAGQIMISEFRLRGPVPTQTPAPGNEAGQLDEFIELYNNTDSDFVVADVAPVSVGTAGWAIVSSDDPTTPKYVIPAGTRIPARGHFLVTNSLGYSLSAYAPADNVAGPAAASYNADIPDGSGISLYRTGSLLTATPADRLDSVGFLPGVPAGAAPSLAAVPLVFSEGVPLSPAEGVGEPSQHSFLRRLSSGRPQDTEDNGADFEFVSTDGGEYSGRQSTLGAPGPQNSESPVQLNQRIKASLIDPTVSYGEAPNSVRRICATPGVEECLPNRSQNGTFSIRRRWTNNTGADVTRLRFRIVSVTTGPTPPAGTADLRALSSGQVTNVAVANVAAVDNSVTIEGTTLEEPPTQALGGGLNATLAAGTVTLDDPLVPRESVNLQFLLGVQQPGAYRFFVNVEAVTEASPPIDQQPSRSKAGAASPKKAGAGKGAAGRQ